MRTTLNLDDHLMHDLLRVTHADTKTQAVTEAVKDHIRRKQLEELRQLRGQVPLRKNWRRLEQLELRSMKRLGRQRG